MACHFLYLLKDNTEIIVFGLYILNKSLEKTINIMYLYRCGVPQGSILGPVIFSICKLCVVALVY